jgi:hypothetical protein
VRDRGLVRVRLLELPVPTWQRTQQHLDELLREFALLAHSERTDALPNRLLSLADRIRASYSAYLDAQSAHLRATAERGGTRVDLEFRVPPDMGDAADELDQMLDEADAYCECGDLLTLATPPDARRFRRWYFAEFSRQAAGEGPRPWSAFDASSSPG